MAHEEVAREVDDAERDAVALDERGAPPRLGRQEVGRADDVAPLLEVRPDLAVAVGVVAERDHVGAGPEQLVGVLRGDADAAGGVLAVDDDEVRAELRRAGRRAWSGPRAGRSSRRRRRRRGSRSSARTLEDRPPRRRILREMEERASTSSAGGVEDPPLDAGARRIRRRRGRARRRGPSSRWWSRAGSRRSCCRWRSSAPTCCCTAAGPVALIFIVAALVALLLNPFVVMLQRARVPARARRAVRLPGADRRRGRHRRRAGRPDRRPGLALLRQRARASSTTPTPSSPTCRPGSTTTGSTSRSPSQGKTALETLGDRVTEGSGELVTFTREARARRSSRARSR